MKKNTEDLKKLAKKWVELCDDDMRSVYMEFKETKNFTLVSFLCQQVVERYMKAFLMIHENPIEGKLKTHELLVLLGICNRIDSDFEDWRIELKVLDKFYINTRYPTFWGSIVQEKDAYKCIEYTEQFIKFVKEKLKF